VLVVAALALVHLAAFFLYTRLTRQSELLALYVDAREQWKAGRLEAAAAEYREFLGARRWAAWPVVLARGFPSAADGWFVLGRIETARGATDAALAAFERAMAEEPGRGRREYRDLLLTSGRSEALATLARRELAADPTSAPAAKDLGAALLGSGDPAGAAAAYRQALALLPDYLARHDPAAVGRLSSQEADLINLLSVALRLAGDGARADELCADLSRRQPRGAHLDRLCRAHALAAQGDTDGARAELRAYQPPAPEHEALAAALTAQLARG
jgi:tetratricopeptide (TPR) repeat protein